MKQLQNYRIWFPPVRSSGTLVRAIGMAALLATLSWVAPPVVSAGGADLSLHRFGECRATDDLRCPRVSTNEEAFRSLASDLGSVMAPRGVAPPQTLGIAGFAFQIDHTFHSIDAGSEGWQLGTGSGEPKDLLMTTQFHMRKGLPFGFELGAMFTKLWDSSISSLGAELRWAFHEDYLWPVPDFGFRGYGATVLGVSGLNMFTTGMDITTGLSFGVGSVMNITPWIGYGLNAVVAATRLIDADPEFRIPQRDRGGDGQERYNSEFVFNSQTEINHRALIGTRFQFTMLDVSFEGAFDNNVQSYTLSLGANF